MKLFNNKNQNLFNNEIFNNKIRVVKKCHCKKMQNFIVRKFHCQKMYTRSKLDRSLDPVKKRRL